MDLIYIDPPFNESRNYEVFWGGGVAACAQRQEKRAFEDRYGDALAYCDYMRPRVEQLHRVLKATGSFYYHCDWHASHYIKVMLDEIFGANFFVNEIIWKRYSSHGNVFNRYGIVTDSVFLYRKSSQFVWNQVYGTYDPKYVEGYFKHVEPGTGRRYQLQNTLNPADDRPNLKYEWNGHTRVWKWTRQKMQEMHDQGKLHYSKTGYPRLKQYLDDMPGPKLQNLWDDIPSLQTRNKESLGYPTQKPLALLERIIKASSNPGDVVLDAFCGCGTALVASQQLGRRWLGIDISPTSVSVMGQRLEDVCGLRLAPPSLGADEVAASWNAASPGRAPVPGRSAEERGAHGGAPSQSYYRFSNLPRSAEQLRRLPGFEFENWAVLQLGEVLRHQGHRITAQTNRSKVGDLGLDGRIYLAERTSLPRKGGELPLMEATGAGSGERQKYLPIQVKNTDKVGRPEIDKFEAALRRDGRPAGFFIGWEFSSDAVKEVERLKKLDDPLYIVPVRVQTLIEESFDVELMLLRGM